MLVQCVPDCGALNTIWETGTTLQSWKIAQIIPLLKPNTDMTEISSYHPVALTSAWGNS